MASFRLSERSKAELFAIYEHSDAYFGAYQQMPIWPGLNAPSACLATFRARLALPDALRKKLQTSEGREVA